jgi:hypothetical protein
MDPDSAFDDRFGFAIYEIMESFKESGSIVAQVEKV